MTFTIERTWEIRWESDCKLYKRQNPCIVDLKYVFIIAVRSKITHQLVVRLTEQVLKSNVSFQIPVADVYFAYLGI